MKKVIIIHAWDSGPDQHWYKEEKELLEKQGVEVFLPEMLGGLWPKLSEWLGVIQDLQPNEETILIGHSLGVPAILRYLESSNQKIDKAILVAPFARDLGMEETRNFVEAPFDWEKIQQLANKFVVIAQSEDPYIKPEIAKEVADGTGGEWILVEGNNHFDKMDLGLINKEIL
jgi:predicted alpha/beta hydrolase family esterase